MATTPKKAIEVSLGDWIAHFLPREVRQAWTNADALHTLINHGTELGAASKLIPAAQQLKRLEPDSPRASVTLGAVLLAAGNRTAAFGPIRESCRQHPEQPEAWLNASKWEARFGKVARALADAEQALALAPNDAHCFGWWLALNRKQGLEAHRVALLEMQKRDTAWRAKIAWAECLYEDGDFACGDAALAPLLSSGEREVVHVVCPLLIQERRRQLLADWVEDGWRRGLLLPEIDLTLARFLLGEGDRNQAKRIALENLNDASCAEEAHQILDAAESVKQLRVSEDDVRGVALPSPLWSSCRTLSGEHSSGLGSPIVLLAWSVRGVDSAWSRGGPLLIAERIQQAGVCPVTVVPVNPYKGFVVRHTPWPDAQAIALAPDIPDLTQVVTGVLEPTKLTLRFLRRGSKTREVVLETASLLSSVDSALKTISDSLGASGANIEESLSLDEVFNLNNLATQLLSATKLMSGVRVGSHELALVQQLRQAGEHLERSDLALNTLASYLVGLSTARKQIVVYREHVSSLLGSSSQTKRFLKYV